MTICIGAICRENNEDRFVVCADTQIGIEGFASSETGFKVQAIGPGIVAMIAGTIARGRELCAAYGSHFCQILQPTKANILDVMKEPPKVQKKRLIDEYFGTTWGVTYEDFLNGKLSQLPKAERSKIADDIRAVRLDCSLVICAFVEGAAFLFVCDDSGVFQYDDFATVGSGSSMASASLYRRQYHRSIPIDTAVYVAYEAKKFSEIL